MKTKDKIEIIRLLNIQFQMFADVVNIDKNEKEIELFIESKDKIHDILSRDEKAGGLEILPSDFS